MTISPFPVADVKQPHSDDVAGACFRPVMPTQACRTDVVDLSDICEGRRQPNRKARLLHHLARETLGDQLAVFDHAAGKSPERLLTGSTLQDECDVVPAPADGRRDRVGGTQGHPRRYVAAARTADRERARSSAAATNSRKSGAGRVGRDLNSGWN